MIIKYNGKVHDVKIVTGSNTVPHIKGETIFESGINAEYWNKYRNDIEIIRIIDEEKEIMKKHKFEQHGMY